MTNLKMLSQVRHLKELMSLSQYYRRSPLALLLLRVNQYMLSLVYVMGS